MFGGGSCPRNLIDEKNDQVCVQDCRSRDKPAHYEQ